MHISGPQIDARAVSSGASSDCVEECVKKFVNAFPSKDGGYQQFKTCYCANICLVTICIACSICAGWLAASMEYNIDLITI